MDFYSVDFYSGYSTMGREMVQERGPLASESEISLEISQMKLDSASSSSASSAASTSSSVGATTSHPEGSSKAKVTLAEALAAADGNLDWLGILELTQKGGSELDDGTEEEEDLRARTLRYP